MEDKILGQSPIYGTWLAQVGGGSRVTIKSACCQDYIVLTSVDNTSEYRCLGCEKHFIGPVNTPWWGHSEQVIVRIVANWFGVPEGEVSVTWHS